MTCPNLGPIVGRGTCHCSRTSFVYSKRPLHFIDNSLQHDVLGTARTAIMLSQNDWTRTAWASVRWDNLVHQGA